MFIFVLKIYSTVFIYSFFESLVGFPPQIITKIMLNLCAKVYTYCIFLPKWKYKNELQTQISLTFWKQVDKILSTKFMWNDIVPPIQANSSIIYMAMVSSSALS